MNPWKILIINSYLSTFALGFSDVFSNKCILFSIARYKFDFTALTRMYKRTFVVFTTNSRSGDFMFDRQRGGRKPLTRVLIYSTVHGMVGFVLFARLFFVSCFFLFRKSQTFKWCFYVCATGRFGFGAAFKFHRAVVKVNAAFLLRWLFQIDFLT